MKPGWRSLFGLDPRSYEPHPLHRSDRIYPETNCYTDVLIEFLHARGDEPLAVLGCALEVDFEGDQWTFFKPRTEELERYFGIDIHEMQPYRPLPEQIAEQIAMERTLIVELDSWYLPDRANTSYRREHVKTSVVAEAIDTDRQRLRYFHGGGYYELSGEDYEGAFRLGGEISEDVLPPYTELARLDAGKRLDPASQRRLARQRLAEIVARRPPSNPFRHFGCRLRADLPRLLQGSQLDYHEYAFATVRMAGAAFEVGGAHVEWALGERAAPARSSLEEIVEGCKALSFKLARRREFDPRPSIHKIAGAWESGFARLEDALG